MGQAQEVEAGVRVGQRRTGCIVEAWKELPRKRRKEAN